MTILLLAALAAAALATASARVSRTFTLEGTVDCGRQSGRDCPSGSSLAVLTSSIDGSPRRVDVDVSWIGEKLPALSQDRSIVLEVEDLPNGELRALGAVDEAGDERQNQARAERAERREDQDTRSRPDRDEQLQTGSGPSVGDWAWLAGTFWYVPAPNLPAFLLDAQQREVRPIADQTVYFISDYQLGYFWGMTALKVGPSPVTCMSLLGSVTPEGDVLLTFTPVSGSSDGLVTQGFGVMRERAGQWTMENQMTTGPNARFQLAHWAYMLQTRPGEASFQSLPGVNVSVPTFMQPCPAPPSLRRT
jgi:hypothetical protein